MYISVREKKRDTDRIVMSHEMTNKQGKVTAIWEECFFQIQEMKAAL